MEGHFRGVAAVIAAPLAVPQFVPQLRRVRRGLIAGVSWTWAVMTCINNIAWVVYFTWSGHYTALIPASAAVVVSGLLAVQPAFRMDAFPAPVRGHRGRLTSVMALAAVIFGRAGVAPLSRSRSSYRSPSVSTAYRSSDISGISVSTWLLVFGELTAFSGCSVSPSTTRN